MDPFSRPAMVRKSSTPRKKTASVAAPIAQVAQTAPLTSPVAEVLAEIASSMSSDANIEQMLTRFLGIMVRISGARAGAVRVLTADGGHLRLAGSINLSDQVLERERFVPLGCGVCGKAVSSLIPEEDQVMTVCQKQVRHAYLQQDCARILAIPLRHKGKVLGVYNLFMEQDQVIPDDIRFLFNSISEHLGMALENMRLTRENMRISLISERTMLANQIHDSLAQTLAYAKMRLSVLHEAVQEGHMDDTQRYLGDVEEAVDMAYSELRNLITQFRDRIDPRGLVPALTEMVKSFRQKANADVEFLNLTQDVMLLPEEEIQVFHIIQEALYNISKHARARHVVVTLDLEDGEYVVNVADDGVGLIDASASVGRSFGLTIMRERAEKLGGQLLIESRPAGGTTVRLRFPAAKGIAKPDIATAESTRSTSSATIRSKELF